MTHHTPSCTRNKCWLIITWSNGLHWKALNHLLKMWWLWIYWHIINSWNLEQFWGCVRCATPVRQLWQHPWSSRTFPWAWTSLKDYMMNQTSLIKSLNWSDITIQKMKKFLVIIILMGQVKKDFLRGYWSTDPHYWDSNFLKTDEQKQIWIHGNYTHSF